MAKIIHAIFENGVFRPVDKISLPEHQEVEIIIQEDIPTRLIAVVAERTGGFDFLADPREDIYTIADGEPI
ncbi:MAG: antitoxin family protein [Candidatus Omnitrophica bacterium]|nr:antitoxin family protein [Candidatus Omnitrophota bacterium]